MKKLIRCLLLIIAMLFTYAVNAEVVDKDDIPKGTYVIGTHTFDRNKTDNYDGTLTVQHIMLAAKTIESNNLEDMKIYFKNSRGKWVNPIDNSIIPDTNIPEQFEVVYQNVEVVDIEIPDVTNKTVEVARQELANAGFTVNTTIEKENSDTIEAGKVIRTSPSAGSIVKKDTVVTIYESLGREKTYHEKLIDLANSFPEEISLKINTTISDSYVISDYIGKKHLANNNVVYDKISVTKETLRFIMNEETNYLTIGIGSSNCGGLTGACGGGMTVVRENASHCNISHVNLNQNEINQLNEFKSEVNEAIQEAKESFANGTYSKLFVTNEIVKNIASKYGYDVLSDNSKYYELNWELESNANNGKNIWLKQDSDIYFIVKNDVLYDAISFEDDYDIAIYRDNTEYKNTNVTTALNQAVDNFIEATGINNYDIVPIDDDEYDSNGSDEFMQYAVFITDKDIGNMWVVIFEIKQELTIEEQLQKYLNQFPNELSIDVYNGVKDTEYSSIWHALNYKLIEYSRDNNININFKHTTEMRFENDYWLEFTVAPDATATGSFNLILSSEDKTVQKTINYQVNYTDLSGEELNDLSSLQNEINEHNASIRDNVEKGIYGIISVYQNASEGFINSKMAEYNFSSYRFETQSIPIQYSGVELYGNTGNYYIIRNGIFIDVLSLEIYSGISYQTNLIADKSVNLDEYISNTVMPDFQSSTGVSTYTIKKNYERVGTVVVNESQNLYRNDYRLVVKNASGNGTEWCIWFSQYVNL